MDPQQPDKQQVLASLDCQLDSNLNMSMSSQANTALNYLSQCGDMSNITNAACGSITTFAGSTDNQYCTGWQWWRDYYYPSVIRESYPVYIQERAQDKGKQAYEIIKTFNDKHILKLDTVRDFIEAMDTLLKIL